MRHHIEHWADGGPTSLGNGVALCGFHHRVVHHRGWAVHLDDTGVPTFVPPRWIDPRQVPIRPPWRQQLRELARSTDTEPEDPHPD